MPWAVYEKGSSEGSDACCHIHWPDFRCQKKSGSLTGARSGKNETAKMAATRQSMIILRRGRIFMTFYYKTMERRIGTSPLFTNAFFEI
jgi:hypothetical protein